MIPTIRIILCLFLVASLGMVAWNYYERTQHPSVAQRAGDLADRTKEKAADLKEAVVEKSHGFGDEIADTRIIAAIKAKYFMDKELSALAISIECRDGKVVLTGTTASPELIARAVQLTRQTSGVSGVTSKLRVKN